MAKNDIVLMNIEDILVDESFNSRLLYDGTAEEGGTIESLAKDIKRKGLLQPPVVRSDENGKVHLVAGFRRMRALIHNGEKVVPVSHMGTLDEQEALLANIAENVQRLTLRPAELANALSRLSAGGMSGAAIAGQVGLSKAHVNNLLRIRSKATPYIWGKWSAGQINTPEVLAAIGGGSTEDEQRAALERHLGARTAEPGESGGSESVESGESGESEKPAKVPDPRPKRTELEAFEQACREILAGRMDYPKNKGLDDVALVVIRDTLAWVNGNRKKPPFTMPKAPEAAVADEE